MDGGNIEERMGSIAAVLLGVVGVFSAYWSLQQLGNGYIFVGGALGVYQINTLLNLLGELLAAYAAFYSAWFSYKGEGLRAAKGIRLMAVSVLLSLAGSLLLDFGLFLLTFSSCMELLQKVLCLAALWATASILSRDGSPTVDAATAAIACLAISCAMDLVVVPLTYSIVNGYGFTIDGLDLIWELCLLFAVYILIGLRLSPNSEASSGLWTAFCRGESFGRSLDNSSEAGFEARRDSGPN